MANLDDRIVRLGIEVDGRINWYEGLNIYGSGTKFASVLANEAEFRITNLKRSTRDFILTAVSPYNLNRTDKKIILQAGRPGRNVYQIYTGTIIRAEPSQPPDITLTIKARTCDFQSKIIVSNTLGTNVPLSQISQKIADDLGLSLNFQATDKLISNYSFSGGATKQVDLIGQYARVNAYIDDNTFVVKDYGVPLSGSLIIVNQGTGMIGLPQLDIQGVTVKFLIDNVPQLGGAIDVQSKINPACNGRYSIYKLDFEIASRDTPFYWTARASRPGIGL